MSTAGKARPSRLTTTKSFSRYEPSSSSTPMSTRDRASTLSNDVLSPGSIDLSTDETPQSSVFEKEEEKDVQTPILRDTQSGLTSPELLDAYDDVPIELISLSDRFITSLTTAKIYPTPPSIEKLSELFQEFYLQAESNISTHIQALLTKESRGKSPAPSIASRISNSSKSRSTLSSQPSQEKLSSDKTIAAQQMLTPSEISERRKARKMLEYRRIALEEAIERKVCESIYPKLYRHKDSLDEIRDDKLKSKTAALALVGISLKDLGATFEDSSGNNESVDQDEIERWIAKARAGILGMNDAHHPLGKLKSLAAAHQDIVAMLTLFRKSSSSADEILPTLIYTLITCPPESIQVISNLYFIQRFRATSKVNGESAYCLTNLEAAIGFLENVDLATLKSEDAIESQSRQNTPAATYGQETEFPFNKEPDKAATRSITPLKTLPSRPSSSSENKTVAPLTPTHARKLSTIFQPSANAIGAASDAVRSSADAGLKNISQAMDNSFNMLFGRLKETVVSGPGSTSRGTVAVPKTLDEARKLVSPRPLIDEDGNISEQSSFTEQEDSPREGRILDMIAGRPRDRSTDSTSSIGRKLALQQPSSEAVSGSPPTSTPLSALDSMRNLGNSLNPLNRFAGVSAIRGFGRSNTSSPAITPSPLASHEISSAADGAADRGSPLTARFDPPLQRFVNTRDAGELKLAEIQALLDDYHRLAKIVKDSRLY